ncbi:MAG TPA: 50S ribosomal protein L11 methyltransferase, partial [Dehalococcoidia bacterium]|nr:50S ribosomal protein L11 methyltransferase [Dehalococcoidia bacterium]
GMAFGTGQHPTTRLCLAAIEKAVQPGHRVLDVGAGSGILSLCAALCGAAEVIGVDLDQQTVKAAEANAELNHLSAATTFRHGTMGERWPADLPPPTNFDLVVANISSRAITSLAAELASALTTGGTLLTSGFLEESVDEVRSSLEGAGLEARRTRRRGEWRLIEASKT